MANPSTSIATISVPARCEHERHVVEHRADPAADQGVRPGRDRRQFDLMPDGRQFLVLTPISAILKPGAGCVFSRVQVRSGLSSMCRVREEPGADNDPGGRKRSRASEDEYFAQHRNRELLKAERRKAADAAELRRLGEALRLSDEELLAKLRAEGFGPSARCGRARAAGARSGLVRRGCRKGRGRAAEGAVAPSFGWTAAVA